MSFRQFDSNEIAEAAQRLQQAANSLNKSFSAGTPGAANAERTGLAAFALDDVSKTMESLTIKEEDFLLSKEIKTVPAKQTLYEYVVKTSAGVDVDVWGMENMLPQESQGNYRRVAEIIKVMGIRKSITHLAQQVNDVGGYALDLNQENEENALLTLGNALERALYNGGDNYIDAAGAIDNLIAANINGPVRVIRGIQAQIREGNNDPRGVIQDFLGYANNRSTVIDAAGQTLTRGLLDDVVTAVNGNKGRIEEVHCTPEQIRLFRASLFPVDRGMIGEGYAVRGSDMTTEHKSGFSVGTTNGPVQIRSTLFKNEMIYLVPQQGTAGIAPNAPTVALSSQTTGNTAHKAGDVVKYVVQAVNFSGRSTGSLELSVTIAADGNNVILTITPAQNGVVEYYQVYKLNSNESTKYANGIYNHRFIGKLAASRQGASLFVDAQAILPGLNSIVFLPKADCRAQLATIGPRVCRIDFGIRGLAKEHGYVSYLAAILKLPRQHGLMQNVLEEFKF